MVIIYIFLGILPPHIGSLPHIQVFLSLDMFTSSSVLYKAKNKYQFQGNKFINFIHTHTHKKWFFLKDRNTREAAYMEEKLLDIYQLVRQEFLNVGIIYLECKPR